MGILMLMTWSGLRICGTVERKRPGHLAIHVRLYFIYSHFRGGASVGGPLRGHITNGNCSEMNGCGGWEVDVVRNDTGPGKMWLQVAGKSNYRQN